MSHRGDFGEVRSWVRHPNRYSWNKLSFALSEWDFDERFYEQVLPYVTQHLRRWPDDFERWNQPSWLAQLVRDGESPLLALCNALHADNYAIGAEGAALLAASQYTTSLRAIYLVGNGLGDEGFAHLCSAQRFESLVELDVRGNDITRKGAACLTDAPFATQLETLRVLSGNRRWRYRGYKLCRNDPNEHELLAELQRKARARQHERT